MTKDQEAELLAAEVGNVESIDLHGMSKDEASHELQMFLHQQFMLGSRAVKIIHGRGSEVLQKMTLDMLKSERIIDAFQGSHSTHEMGAVTYALLAK